MLNRLFRFYRPAMRRIEVLSRPPARRCIAGRCNQGRYWPDGIQPHLLEKCGFNIRLYSTPISRVEAQGAFRGYLNTRGGRSAAARALNGLNGAVLALLSTRIADLPFVLPALWRCHHG